jgi:hypothetical protein
MLISKLWRLAAGLSPWRLGFNPSPVHVAFVVDKEAMGQVFLRVHRFFPVCVISAVPYAPIFLNTAYPGNIQAE